MRIDIEWEFFLSVTTHQKCTKLLGQIESSLEVEFDEWTIEHYAKGATRHKVIAHSSFDEPTTTDGLYKLMITVSRLAREWVVTGPTEDDQWHFGGTAKPDSIRTQGLTSISFNATSIGALHAA